MAKDIIIGIEIALFAELVLRCENKLTENLNCRLLLAGKAGVSGALSILPLSTLPEPSADGGAFAEAAWEGLFARISNENTRRAYKQACRQFFSFVGTVQQVHDIHGISPLHVAAWRDHLAGRHAAPTVKQRLAAVRWLFDIYAEKALIRHNPAASVRGPKYSVRRGKTPVLLADEARQLLDAIDALDLPALRDRALIAVMVYSFARIGAATGLFVKDVFRQQRRLWLRLNEKGGNVLDVPCHHVLEHYLMAYIEAAGIADTPDVPLFQSFMWERRGANDAQDGKGDDATPPTPKVTEMGSAEACRDDAGQERSKAVRKLSGKPMSQSIAWAMLQRRAKAAGLDTAVCNHTFRATGITAYLKNGGTLERAAAMAGHASTRTTQLYDRRPDDITLDEIEKIRI
jgi:site-specific recombinase XerD